MKKQKILISTLLAVVLLVSCASPVLATNVDSTLTLQEYLSENGITLQSNSVVSIITEADDTQHIEVAEMLDGEIAVSILSYVDETEEGLANIKIVPSVPSDSRVNLSKARASVPMVELIGNTGVTITVTAYYTQTTLPNDFTNKIYQPSGVTVKWSRSSGSSTVNSITGYFAITGDLYDSNYNFVRSDYYYEANITKANPVANVIYSDYETIPSDGYIDAYPFAGMNEAGVGYFVTINGKEYTNSVAPF